MRKSGAHRSTCQWNPDARKRSRRTTFEPQRSATAQIMGSDWEHGHLLSHDPTTTLENFLRVSAAQQRCWSQTSAAQVIWRFAGEQKRIKTLYCFMLYIIWGILLHWSSALIKPAESVFRLHHKVLISLQRELLERPKIKDWSNAR